MARSDFIIELQALGYTVEDRGDGRLCFPFTVPVGKCTGQAVLLGFLVQDDFPLAPPGGPHFSPHLLPINTNGGEHPLASVHPSPFGESWQYWSRPMHHWGQTKKKAKDVLAHVLRLLETL